MENDNIPMTKPETRYQKYLARKRQKQEAKQEKKMNQPKPDEAGPLANAPIHECLIPANLFEQGIGHLVFSRSLPDGRIALAMFLLDVFCLGIKDAFFAKMTRGEYGSHLDSLRMTQSLQPIEPACLRKLVEGGVAYARDLGFSPQSDYAEARPIFGDVDTAACSSHFEYGHAGKPFYISGPHESATQVRAIVDQLQQRLGAGNFEYLVLAG